MRWTRALLGALAFASAADAQSRARTRPNIIFIFTDDHAANAISAYGGRYNQTPNLDRIAREGMLFNRAFVTNAICGPSRATVLTGQFGHLNGVPTNNDSIHPTALTFPKLLRASGYQTAVIGKWHLWTRPEGFDHFEILHDQGTYYNPLFYRPKDTVTIEGYTTDVITDRALAWIGQRDAKKPFLLMYQHKAPHRPWDPGPDHLDQDRQRYFPEAYSLFDDYATRGRAAREQEMTIARHLVDRDLKFTPPPELTPAQLSRWNRTYEPLNAAFRDSALTDSALVRWKFQRYLGDYLRTVQSVDDNVGRMLKYLDDNGLAQNTIVIYSSDQGFFLGEHGWFDKRFMYEESMRTPLMIRWPGVVKPGTVSDDLVQNLDYAETMLEMAGVRVPRSMQGRSLVPILRGRRPADWRNALYYQYYEYPGWHMVRRHYGVRTNRFKLIHFYEIGEWELYDLNRDPYELNNVYALADYKRTVYAMKRRLNQLREQYRVPAVDAVPYPTREGH